MNRFMKMSLLASALVGVVSVGFNAPAEAHHHNNNYANELAMQMYANNLAIQQQQAAYCNSGYYNNGYYPQQYAAPQQVSYVNPQVNYATPLYNHVNPVYNHINPQFNHANAYQASMWHHR